MNLALCKEDQEYIKSNFSEYPKDVVRIIEDLAEIIVNKCFIKPTPKQIEAIKEIGGLVKYPKLVELLNDYKYLQDSMAFGWRDAFSIMLLNPHYFHEEAKIISKEPEIYGEDSDFPNEKDKKLLQIEHDLTDPISSFSSQTSLMLNRVTSIREQRIIKYAVVQSLEGLSEGNITKLIESRTTLRTIFDLKESFYDFDKTLTPKCANLLNISERTQDQSIDKYINKVSTISNNKGSKITVKDDVLNRLKIWELLFKVFYKEAKEARNSYKKSLIDDIKEYELQNKKLQEELQLSNSSERSQKQAEIATNKALIEYAEKKLTAKPDCYEGGGELCPTYADQILPDRCMAEPIIGMWHTKELKQLYLTNKELFNNDFISLKHFLDSREDIINSIYEQCENEPLLKVLCIR